MFIDALEEYSRPGEVIANMEVLDDLLTAHPSPFPLEGGRAGDGGECRALKRKRNLALSPSEPAAPTQRLHPPPCPPPLEGGGFFSKFVSRDTICRVL